MSQKVLPAKQKPFKRPSMIDWWYNQLFLALLVNFLVVNECYGAVPRFFESNRMSLLRLPRNTEVNTVIYRLRAQDTDRDYPLIFDIKGPIGLNLIYIEAHECTASTDIFCEADVYLRKPVEVGRIYIFNLTVTDQRGYSTEIIARVDATNGRTTPLSEIFVSYSPTIEMSEDTPVKSVISSMVVRKRKTSTFGELHVVGPARKRFRMAPSNLVSTELINGTLILEKSLDFEEANLHAFKVCLLQPFTEERVDTRNIACIVMSVIVEDVQDEPPVFIKAPPVSKVKANLVQGDTVVQVEAKDGDRGTPRELRYSILPSSSLYTQFFRMNQMTGIITMNETAMKLREKMVSLDPILMTVTAEEVTSSLKGYPALSSSVEIAFVVLEAEFLEPKFIHEIYVGEIYEDSRPDTEVFFNSPFLAPGVKGLFSLELVGDKGAFSVQPGVVTDSGDIRIKVKNSFLLDYERVQQINFKLFARQVTGRRQTSSSTEITIRVIDINDNLPEFSQPQYEVEIFENIPRGTSVARIYATDKDSGEFGIIRYTNIYGTLAQNLYLDPVSGVITCATDNHGFDREEASEYVFTVEAKDNSGQGAAANTVTAKLIIRIKDINDSPPKFVDSIYKGVMAPDLQRLRDPLLIRAIDNDAEKPNNEVIYDLMRSSYSDFFSIDRVTGRLDVNRNHLPRAKTFGNERFKRSLGENDTVISLVVKASDLGNPPLSDYVDVKIFKQEYGERVIRFIYPKNSEYVQDNSRELVSNLNALTGGNTEIMSIQPLRKGYLNSEIDHQKSDVTALVRFGINTVIDVEQLMTKLNNSEVQKLQVETQEKAVVITTLEDRNNSYAIGVAFLSSFLVFILLILLVCFFCAGCPLHRSSKSLTGGEGEEGVSYVRVENTGRYRRSGEGISETPSWWQRLPSFLQDLFLFCGYIPPSSKSSRMAWSGDERERERFGKPTRNTEKSLWHDRVALAQNAAKKPQPLHLEDVDVTRGPTMQVSGQQNQVSGPQNFRIDSRNSQFSQEPRRVFVLKDAMGIPRAGEGLREGNTYLLEDREDQARDFSVIQQQQPDSFQPGNAKPLRPHASLPDADFYNENFRRSRQADVPPEGFAHIPNGRVTQIANNNDFQRNTMPLNQGSVTRSMNEHPNDKHLRNQQIQREIEGARFVNYQDSEQVSHGETSNKRNLPKNYISDTDRILQNTSIPNSNGYQHTKTSILRYESNKEKLEERKEELLRQGKELDEYCITHQGGGFGIFSEIRKGIREKEKTKLESRRNQSYSSNSGDRKLAERPSEYLENKKTTELLRNGKSLNENFSLEKKVNLVQPENIRTKEEYYLQANINDTNESKQMTSTLSENKKLANYPVSNIDRSQVKSGYPSAISRITLLPSENDAHQDTIIPSNETNNKYVEGVTNSVEEKSIVPEPTNILTGKTTDMIIATHQEGQTKINLEPVSEESSIAGKTKEFEASDMFSALSKQDSANLVKSRITHSTSDQSNLKPKPTNSEIDVQSTNKNEENATEESNSQSNILSKEEVEASKVIFEKNIKNDSSILRLPLLKQKTLKLMEKKSIFTRAYDGMKMDQLRPDSASKFP